MTAAPHFADHLVIGGGPAGSMVALCLAAAGRQVVLLEKEREAHHKVCGEFLSREAVDYLHQAGVDPLQLGAAEINSVRLSSGAKVLETSLPFSALSLSRRILDEALLARAAENGCQTYRGIGVESLTACGDDWLATLSTGATLLAKTVFLATGKHDLRGFVRSPAKQNDLIGFKLNWRLAPVPTQALRKRLELFLFSGGYGGLSLIENCTANLCLVVRRSTLRKLGGWPCFLASILRENRHLRSLLDGGYPSWPRPLAVSSIPYGYIAPERRIPWCIGDQAAVIPSFTGDGISIALHSGALAAQMFLANKATSDFNRILRAQLDKSMSLATWLSRVAVTGAGRGLAPFALSLFPNAMPWIAASTRIPQRSLLVRNDARAFGSDSTPQSV